MTKKISCRVVKSVPLSKSTDTLRHISQPADRHREDGRTVAESVNYIGNAARAAGWVCLGEGVAGQILDCYV